MSNLICPFCNEPDLLVSSPIEYNKDSDKKNPSYVCYKCSVRIVVTNPSYMKREEFKRYWRIVLSKTIGKQ